MKIRILTLFLFIFNSQFLFSQKKNTSNYVQFYEDNKTKKIEGVLNEKGRNGIWKWYYRNGIVGQSGKYLNDKQEGIWKEFNENGKLTTLKTYKKGLVIGKSTSYFDTGQLRSETEYKNGLKNGNSIVYYQNGEIQEQTFFKNGKPVGNFISFFENRNIGLTGQYNENGEKIGIWKFYRADKSINQTIEYISENEFIETNFDINGNIMEVKNTKNK